MLSTAAAPAVLLYLAVGCLVSCYAAAQPPPPNTTAKEHSPTIEEAVEMARNGTLLPNVPLNCRTAVYSRTSLQPCYRSIVNNRTSSIVPEIACYGPHDGRPGSFCSDNTTLTILSDIQEHCGELISIPDHPVSQAYANKYLYLLITKVRCLKDQQTGEWCHRKRERDRNAGVDRDKCNNCKRQHVQLSVDFKSPVDIVPPPYQLTKDSLYSDQKLLDACGVKWPNDKVKGANASPSSAQRIFPQATGTATSTALFCAILLLMLSLV